MSCLIQPSVIFSSASSNHKECKQHLKWCQGNDEHVFEKHEFNNTVFPLAQYANITAMSDFGRARSWLVSSWWTVSARPTRRSCFVRGTRGLYGLVWSSGSYVRSADEDIQLLMLDSLSRVVNNNWKQTELFSDCSENKTTTENIYWSHTRHAYVVAMST